MQGGTILFRCDANVTMGTGHVMRCLALAQAWQDAGGNAIFAMAETTPAIELRLQSDRFDVVRVLVSAGSPEDSAQTVDLARREGATWVVVDGYQFDSGFQVVLKDAGLRVLFVDDNGNAAPYSADIVLNQNVHASEKLYRDRATHLRLLLGPRYVMLRREFAFWRTHKRETAPAARRVLVTMGGSDPDNVTEPILRVLLGQPELELTVVAGGSNPHFSRLDRLVEGANGPVRLFKDVLDMPALMVWADVAVAGAGTTSWEMCMMGLPAILCVLAPNQERIASELSRLGAAIEVGYAAGTPSDKVEAALRELFQSETARRLMSQRGRDIVDGRGVERVVAFLWGDPAIRRTTESDCRNFWEWANDPEARAVSFTKESSPWERYVDWFRSSLRDPRSILYTAINREGRAIGMVRYQLEGSRAILSINLGAAFRGRGNGRKILFLATEELFQRSDTSVIDAYVSVSNQRSIHLFEGGGFRNVGIETVYGQQAIHFVLNKSVLQ